jgi:ribosome biogenesis GTPase
MSLLSFGWNELWARQLEDFLQPGRVVGEDRVGCEILTEHGLCRVPEHAAVGDWVGLDAAGRVRQVLPRRTQLARRAAGRPDRQQVVAANVDRVFIVTSANQDWNPRRVDRYVVAARDGGAEPVVVLSKVDLCPDPAALAAVLPRGLPVIAASALHGDGIAELRAWIPAGTTATLVGSSGVGKSSLINRLLGDEAAAPLDTGGIREHDDRGKHTTTRRQLMPIAGGGVVIDTPGMRSLGLWLAADTIDAAFTDVTEFADGCRFRDCAHAGEPDCAVRAAVEAGWLAEERIASWHKLRREAKRQEDRAHRRSRQAYPRRGS